MTRECDVSETGEGRETPTLLGPSERGPVIDVSSF
jgi:hypothetical protein